MAHSSTAWRWTDIPGRVARGIGAGSTLSATTPSGCPSRRSTTTTCSARSNHYQDYVAGKAEATIGRDTEVAEAPTRVTGNPETAAAIGLAVGGDPNQQAIMRVGCGCHAQTAEPVTARDVSGAGRLNVAWRSQSGSSSRSGGHNPAPPPAGHQGRTRGR
jgi:hypothetical protein